MHKSKKFYIADCVESVGLISRIGPFGRWRRSGSGRSGTWRMAGKGRGGMRRGTCAGPSVGRTRRSRRPAGVEKRRGHLWLGQGWSGGPQSFETAWRWCDFFNRENGGTSRTRRASGAGREAQGRGLPHTPPHTGMGSVQRWRRTGVRRYNAFAPHGQWVPSIPSSGLGWIGTIHRSNGISSAGMAVTAIDAVGLAFRYRGRACGLVPPFCGLW